LKEDPDFKREDKTRGWLVKKGYMFEDPKKGSCLLKFLRFVHKSVRIFSVSFNYYFLPFVSLLWTFFTQNNVNTCCTELVNGVLKCKHIKPPAKSMMEFF